MIHYNLIVYPLYDKEDIVNPLMPSTKGLVIVDHVAQMRASHRIIQEPRWIRPILQAVTDPGLKL